MFLKSIELFGFKSFPDRTKLDFKNGITVIVGPNGCGKSNISDAVRWVFGERGTKSLRAKKMEDVIFNGAAGRPASGFAEVSLFLDNADRGLGVDEDEVCVTRRIYRSGETEYLINKKSVRLADLIEMFMDTGLGTDGYSLIGQGRISEIVSANSKERREIFEEAAGIAKHRFRREEAEKNLARAGENMVRLTDIMSELEGRVEPLRIAAQKAEKFVELSAEKTGLELGVWLNTLTKSEAALKKLTDDTAAAEAQTAETEIKIAQAQADMEGIFAASQSYNVTLDGKRREIEELQRRAADISAKAELARNDGAHRQAETDRLQSQIEQYRALMADSDRAAAASLEKIKQYRELCAKTDEETARTEAQLAALNASEGGKQQRYEQLYGEIEATSRRLNEARIAQVQAGADRDQLAAKLAEAKDALGTHTSVIEDMEEDVKLLGDDAAQIAGDIEKHSNARAGLDMALASLHKRADAARAEISALQVESDGLRHKAQTLEDMEKQMEGYAGSVKAVIARGANGGLKGIRGTVAQLISVDDRFAVAIEVALGGALQNVVTETEEQAKYAINYLKANDLGRATFLPIGSVSGDILNERDFAGCAGYLGVAAKLVTCDAEYSRIIARLLGRTAVCEDMDTAIAAARKTAYRCRIVTLDGQVINAGGSMTGGSLNRNSGTLSRAGLVKKYREEAAAAAAKLAEKQRELEKLNAGIAEAEAKVAGDSETASGLASEKTRIDMELAQAVRNRDQTKAAIASLGASVGDMTAKLTELEKKTAALKLDGEVAGELLEKKNAESRELSEGRTDFFTRREALLGGISAKKLQTAEYMKEISLLNNGVELAGADKKQKSDAIAATQAEIAAAGERGRAADSEIAALSAEYEKANSAVAAAQHDAEQIAAERDANEIKTNEVREREKALTALRQNLEGERARLSERTAAAQREYDTTVGRLWDEYELTREAAAAKAIPIANQTEASRELNKLREKIRQLGDVNPAAPDEYREVSERYAAMKTQYDDITRSQDELNKLIKSLNATMTEMFTKSFAEINERFGEVFTQLFGGGQAKLLLEDENSPLDCGIEIKAQPPGKTIRNLEALSGGEQSFLAVAIYFAILKVKPTPFCLLDEIESALDDVNVARLAEYMKDMSGNTQFIAITHRRGTMEMADTLYGVTMQKSGPSSGVSKVLYLNVDEVEAKLGIKV